MRPLRPLRSPQREEFTEEEMAGLAGPARRNQVDFDQAFEPTPGAPPLPPKPPRRQQRVVTSKYDDYVLAPDNGFVVAWDVFICTLLFFQAWTVPFEVGVSGGFVWQSFGIPGVLYHLLLSLVFMIDTALCFFRSSRDEHGRLIWRLEDIRWHYLRGWFFLDLISCVPAYSIAFLANPAAGSASFHFLEILQALRLLRIARITRHLKSSPVIVKFSLRFSQGSIQVLRISLVCLYVAHCMACTLCFVHLLEDGPTWVFKYVSNDHTLLDPMGSGMQHSLDLYILALYWATTTMVSVGYGDVTPYTRVEYWVVSILVLVSAALWAWVVAGLVDLVGQLEADSNQLRKRLAIINRVASEHRPSSDQDAWDELMDESRLYLQTAHWRSKKAQSVETLSAALEGLSQGLRQRILLSQSQESLLHVPYFASARASSVAALAAQMHNRNIWVGETLLDHANALDEDRFLYFIRIGMCISVLDLPSGPEEQEPRIADVVRRLVAGTLAADVDANELRRPGQRGADVSIASQGNVWGGDNFCVSTSSKLFKPARLKALTFCECLALPRTAFLKVMEADASLRAAVRWRVIKLAFLQKAVKPPAD